MAQVPATVYQVEGDELDYTPPSTAVSAGDVVVIGAIPMIAKSDIAVGELGALSIGGVYKVPKDTSTFSPGDAVYWNPTGSPVGGLASSGACTSTASGTYLMGLAAPAATGLTGDALLLVVMTSAKRTVAIAGSMTADDITGSDSNLGIAGKAGSGGAGGIVAVVGGAGDTNAAGGAVSEKGGAGNGTGAGGAADFGGGASGAGATGNGGATTLKGGAAASTNGTGGANAVAGGAATGTGTGGAMTVKGGDSGGASGTAGAATLDSGAATGGTGAATNVGTTNATAVNLAAASIPTNILGPIVPTVGGSTAAAGTTTADATVLPAGTAAVYPTTAADDTKGVRVHASDKVSGRLLLLGNGVSNKILKVYAPSGGTINGAAGDAAFSSASGKGVIIYCLSGAGNTWLAW